VNFHRVLGAAEELTAAKPPAPVRRLCLAPLASPRRATNPKIIEEYTFSPQTVHRDG
jgi:hypothetical protein